MGIIDTSVEGEGLSSETLKLLSVLSETRTLVGHSCNEGWPDVDPVEVGADLDQLIAAVQDPGKTQLPELWEILFAPTGPVQEISLANDWGQVFLGLAKEFDSLEYLLKRTGR